jgi:tripartite-type tricarboxylate transporter receptor subunit TctC
LGFANLVVENWFGVIAPANAPTETRTRLVEWFKAAMNDSEVRAKVASQGLYMIATCGDEFGAVIRKRFDEYGQAIRDSNLKAQ